jgi:hypothetical protein
MRPELCEYEEAVGAALSSGQWNDELVRHLASCSQCADLRLVSQYLASAGTAIEEAAPLPAPGLIWWRAQLAERQEQATRGVAAIDLMQKLAIAVALIGLVAITLLWKPIDWGALLIGVGLLLSSAAVLYGWVRGRI